MTPAPDDSPGSPHRRWPPIVPAVLSAAAVLVANSSGLAIGDDGVGYRAIADSLARGRGFGYFLERPVTIWPPGWPALMSVLDRLTPLDTIGAAIALNAATALILVLLVARLLRRLVVDHLVVDVTVAVVALGASSMVFGHLLMTDFAFAAVVIAWMLALFEAREHDSIARIIPAAALVWLAFMIRYAGVVLIGTGALWLVLDRTRALRARLVRGAVFVGAAMVVPLAWIIRNESVDGTALGVRYSSARGLVGNALDLVATIGNFVVPGVEIERRTVWAAVAAAGILVVAVLAWRVRPDVEVGRIAGWHAVVESRGGLLALHVTIYACYMLYARTTTGLNRLDFRLLNPLYLPLVVLAAMFIDRARRGVGLDHSPAWGRLGTGLLGAWAALNLVVGVGMVGYFATGPDLFVGNYERDAFDQVRDSPALDAVPTPCRNDPTALASNLPNALYPRLEATWSTRLTGLESNDPVDDLEQLERDLADGRPRCLVWIDLEPTYGHLATRQELDAAVDLEEVAASGPVTVYRLEP